MPDGSVEVRDNATYIKPAPELTPDDITLPDTPAPLTPEERQAKLTALRDEARAIAAERKARPHVQAPARHEHRYTVPGRIRTGPDKLLLVLACAEHPEVYRATELGSEDYINALYARVKGV
jgi:hypothetical protein